MPPYRGGKKAKRQKKSCDDRKDSFKIISDADTDVNEELPCRDEDKQAAQTNFAVGSISVDPEPESTGVGAGLNVATNEENGNQTTINKEIDQGHGAGGSQEGNDHESEENQIFEQPTPKIQPILSSNERMLLSWSDRTSVKITFLQNQSIALCIIGKARLECLEGNLSVLGYELRANTDQNSIDVFSPSWSSYATLTDVNVNTRIFVHSIRPKKNDIGALHPTFQLLNPTNSRPTLIPPTWSAAVDSIVNEFALNRSNAYQCKSEKEYMKPFLNRKNGPPSSASNADSENNTGMHDSSRQRARVVVCGAKGVGKSTCIRYIVNRLLSSGYSAIAVLDTDVGQPELSPPGLLSLSLVSRPLHKPPYWNLVDMHSEYNDGYKPVPPFDRLYVQRDRTQMASTTPQIVSIASCIFGSLTSKADPSRYIGCVQYLMSQYKQQLCPESNENDIPLVINMDGWVQGLGFQILTSLLIDTLRPSHVLQINGTTKGKTLDLADAIANICHENGSSMTTLHPIEAFNNVDRVTHADEDGSELCYSVVSSSISSATLRSLRFGAYFLPDPLLWDLMDESISQQGWTDDECYTAQRLAASTPYCVPFHSILFGLIGADRSDIKNEHMVLDALNGVIVGLCCGDSNTTHFMNPHNSYNILDAPMRCLGLGIIRSIDRVRRCFYILTPVAPQMLPSVTILCGGSLQLPAQLLVRGVHSESFPYLQYKLDEGEASGPLGAEPMKSRNNIARRSILRGQEERPK